MSAIELPDGSSRVPATSGSRLTTATCCTSIRLRSVCSPGCRWDGLWARARQPATERSGLPDKEQSVVYRIDPERERVLDSFPAGPGAYFVLRAYDSMWVASYAGDDVWRFSN